MWMQTQPELKVHPYVMVTRAEGEGQRGPEASGCLCQPPGIIHSFCGRSEEKGTEGHSPGPIVSGLLLAWASSFSTSSGH